MQVAIIEIFYATNDNDARFLFWFYYKNQTKIESEINLRCVIDVWLWTNDNDIRVYSN